MKTDINSWHYRWMSYYKWCRHKYGDFDLDYDFRHWRYDNGYSKSDDVAHSLDTFRAYMLQTGMYQPIDFCTYWRAVIVWPLCFIAYWLIVLSASAVALSFVTFTGSLMTIGLVIALLSVLAAMTGIGYLANKLKEALKDSNADGFMRNVKLAIHNPNFCSIMEYDTKKESDNA